VKEWEAKQAAKAGGTAGKPKKPASSPTKGKPAGIAASPGKVLAQTTLSATGQIKKPTATAAASTVAIAKKPPPAATVASQGNGPDHSFQAFQDLCDKIASVPSHTDKTKAIRDFITTGTDGDNFTGDVYVYPVVCAGACVCVHVCVSACERT